MKFWRGPDGAGPRLSDDYADTRRPETSDRIRAIRSEQPSEALPVIVQGSYLDPAGGPVQHEATGTLTATPSLTGSLTLTAQASSSLTATPSLTGALGLLLEASGTLTATPSLGGTLALQYEVSTTLAAMPELSGAAWLTLQAAGTLTAEPVLTATPDGSMAVGGGAAWAYYPPRRWRRRRGTVQHEGAGRLETWPLLVAEAEVIVGDDEDAVALALLQ